MNYYCLPKIYQKYMPVLVYGAILYWLMISVWLGENKSGWKQHLYYSSQITDQCLMHRIPVCDWWQHNQFIPVTVILFNAGAKSYTHTLIWTHTKMHTPVVKRVHANMVHRAISQCWDWVNRFIFPPLVGNLSVFKKVVCASVCACVCVWEVWISHLQTLWFIRSIFAYAHNVINCHALSFRLATSPHACMHTHPPTRAATRAFTRRHARERSRIVTRSHIQTALCVLQGAMMKGEQYKATQPQLKDSWKQCVHLQSDCSS